MRELKFRAWDSEEHEMSDPMTMRQLLTYSPLDDDSADNLMVMQYTGLHDADGVEIYEGDIVEFIGGNSPIRQVVEFATKDINRTYGHGHCGEDKFSGFIISGYCGDRFLVIGNIHQNPELVNT